MSVVDVAAACGVSERAVKMALAGDRVGRRVATKLSALTSIAVADLERGTGGA